MANEVKITVTADDRATPTINGVTSSFGGLKSAVFAAGAAFASVQVTQAITEFGRNAVMAASDASESLSKLRVVFGDQAAALEDFSARSADAFGLSTRVTNEYLGTFGNLLTSMGVSQKASAGMSTSIVQLAADLASFNNLAGGVPEALEKIRAGLVGEAEPLRTLGVNLNQAAIEQEAMRLGLMRTGEELNAANKAQAAYSLILQQTKNAQGDFARTSDGLANSQRRLQAAVENLTAKFGAALYEPVNAITNSIAKLIEQNGESWANGFATGVNALTTAFISASKALDNFNQSQRVAVVESQKAGAQLKEQGGIMRALGVYFGALMAAQGGQTGEVGVGLLVGATKGYAAATDFIDAAENVAGWVPDWISKVKMTEPEFKKVGDNIIGSSQKAAEHTKTMAEQMKAINDQFLVDQVQAYLNGGEKAVAEVKASQDKILAEALSVAGKIAQLYGVDVASIIDDVMKGLTDRAKKLKDAADASNKSIFDLTTQLWRNAGGPNMSVQSAQGFAAIAQAATLGLTGYTTAEGKFIATGSTPGADITEALNRGLLKDTFGTTTIVNVNGVITDPAATGRAVADAINAASAQGGAIISAGAVQ